MSNLPINQVIHGDCLDVMKDFPDESIDCVVTDPPYFKVKAEAWDRQWDKPKQFLAWFDTCVEQWVRILKPNGSLYCFASPQMSARIEVLIAEHLNVLNHLVWKKPLGRWTKTRKENLRRFFPASERIIFAEHYGADSMVKGEPGYQTKCNELRQFVFEPLRAYLDGERNRAGFTTRRVAEAFQKKTGSKTITGMARHWFSRVQWGLPTEENYQWLRELFPATCLRREYEDLRREYEDLRREYEDLRREYEDLRRPFSVTSQVPYTDVWTFEPVQSYKGKHPCEKPQKMLQHIIRTSTNGDDLILDPFAGSGSTCVAAKQLGRRYIGIELDEKYVKIARERLKQKELF